MSIESTRRAFLGGAAGLLAARAPSGAAPIEDPPNLFKLGVATYSLRKFSRSEAIQMTQQLKTPYVSVKEFHLRNSSTPEELEQGRKEFEAGGLKIMSGGNISLQKDDVDDLRRYFEYARRCGMPMIVCAPTHQNLGKIEKLVQEYNIKIAIHNHGLTDKNFATPQSVLEAVKDLDPRCGLCFDMGHTAETGVELIESLDQAGSRLLDVHSKDLWDKRSEANQCDVGEGVLPIVRVFRQLKKMDYRACVNLEYEIHPENPLAGMLKSMSYMRGVRDAL